MTAALTFDRIAVVGATGPTGRVIADAFARGKTTVRTVSRRMDRLDEAFPGPRFEKLAADALDPASLSAAVEGCGLVVDCIGLAGEQMDDHPRTARNLAATLKSANARCIQVSSFWSYMPFRETPITDSHPRSGGPAWSRIRRETEDILRDAGAAIVHLPDFFGPHVHTSLLQMPIAEAAGGKTMNWIGRPETERDYLYVPDAGPVIAALSACEAAYGKDWTVPGSGPLSGNGLAEILTATLGTRVKLRPAGPLMLRLASLFDKDLRAFMPMVPEYLKPMRYDGTKLEALVGNVKRTPYQTAIGETVRHLQSR